MNKQIKSRQYQVIINSESININWENPEWFIESNAQKPPFFGKKASDAGEAAIKAQFTFKDGNIVGLRADKFGHPNYF